jgi:hypothetical protein
MFHVVAAGLLGAAVAAFPIREAAAHPQTTVGITLGGAATDLRDRPHAAFHLGGRADLLFLRSRGRDMALGPYLALATTAFDTIEAGGGLEWLLPVRDDLPLIVSLGALERRAPALGWGPAAEAGISFGSRSYNFHSWYSLGFGLFVLGGYGIGDSPEADVIVGVQTDVMLLVYPLLLAFEAVAH